MVDHDLELVPFGDGALVDVAAEDQLRARVDEAREDVVAPGHRALARAPRGADQLVVQHDDAERAVGGVAQPRLGAFELAIVDAAGLVPPRPHRVDADDVQVLRLVRRLDRLPAGLELAPRRREARRESVRDVVVAGHGEDVSAEAVQEPGGSLVLVASTSMCEVAARHDQTGRRPFDQRAHRVLEDRIVSRSDVQVRDVKDARGHRRSRLYSD